MEVMRSDYMHCDWKSETVGQTTMERDKISAEIENLRICLDYDE